MNRLGLSLTIIILVAAAFATGVGYERWREQPVNELVATFSVTHAAANTVRCVSLLRLLRAGYTERAIEILESHLDGDLIGLGPAFLSANSDQRKRAWAAEALESACEYRTKNPHSSASPEIAQAVAATLAIPTANESRISKELPSKAR